MKKQNIQRVLQILEENYYGRGPRLEFTSSYELLVATMLSAQCTDNQVNKVTRVLFADYNTPEKMIKLSVEELEQYIKSCGFYHNKAKNILLATEKIITEHGGQVPQEIEQLVKLPGVGRKTANVVASNAFGTDAIAVDTHVFRVSNRIGIANSKNVKGTEEDLMRNIDKSRWSEAHHWLIWHGRDICSAQRPKCNMCPISSLCDYYNKGD